MSFAAKIAAARNLQLVAKTEERHSEAAIAGCAGCAGTGTTCSTCAVRRQPRSSLVANGGTYGVMPPASLSDKQHVSYNDLPAEPYADMHVDLACMTPVVGEAVIAGGASTEVVIQPSKGCFEAFYIEIWAWNDADPQSEQHVLVERFFQSDCPTDCRVLGITSRAFQPVGGAGPRRFRSTFGRTPNTENMSVTIQNINAAGNVRVQVVMWGYCLPSPCAC